MAPSESPNTNLANLRSRIEQLCQPPEALVALGDHLVVDVLRVLGLDEEVPAFAEQSRELQQEGGAAQQHCAVIADRQQQQGQHESRQQEGAAHQAQHCRTIGVHEGARVKASAHGALRDLSNRRVVHADSRLQAGRAAQAPVAR